MALGRGKRGKNNMLFPQDRSPCFSRRGRVYRAFRDFWARLVVGGKGIFVLDHDFVMYRIDIFRLFRYECCVYTGFSSAEVHEGHNIDSRHDHVLVSSLTHKYTRSITRALPYHPVSSSKAPVTLNGQTLRSEDNGNKGPRSNTAT